MDKNYISVEVTSVETFARTDLDIVILDLDNEIELLSSHADKWDYLVAVGSGILCSMLDILWVGDFNLERVRSIASEKIDRFVVKAARLVGYEGDDLQEAVGYLEKLFPIPSDGNTPDFGGGKQHHLRDFSHHPTLVGLLFSLLTQFTEYSYGTDVDGSFKCVPVSEQSLSFIGKTIPQKIFNGTVIWFFHLVSDMAGSYNTAGITGGTGIPGPILSLAKELSVLPVFRNIKIGDNKLSVFLSKIFNGTLFAKRDDSGKIIKDSVIQFDLRGEMGAVMEIGKQALPVIANECIVRSFYFIRRLAIELKALKSISLSDLKTIDWDKIEPFKNATVKRMVTVSSAVFSTIDIGAAVLTQKYIVAVNIVGVGRLAVAIGSEISNYLKVRDVKKIKQMYDDIERNVFREQDNNIYSRIGKSLDMDKLGLTLEQTEILYNLELFKTLNDIRIINREAELKRTWLKEWKKYMEMGFPSFVGDENAVLHWYSVRELRNAVAACSPEQIWFRLVLLEAMLFEPYFPLSTETNKKGKTVPSTKYRKLKISLIGYSQSEGDRFLDSFFLEDYYQKGYVARLRKCYNKVTRELNEVLKNAIKTISITAVISLAVVISAGAFAPSIAVALVGSNFTVLSGAALTNACLAYLGGGAIAAGGLGMAGGTMAIVGGGALLGLGLGAGVGGTVGAIGLYGKKGTILQSAKLMVSLREIFLNDEHDLTFSKTVFEQYVQKITEIEKGLAEMRVKAEIADKEKKKELKKQIKEAEEVVDIMRIAMKSMNKYNSSFAIGENETV